VSQSLVALDNLDDRKTIFQLLHRLTQMQRLLYLARCCLVCRKNDPGCTVEPNISSVRALLHKSFTDERANVALSNEIMLDVCMLSMMFKLDMVVAAIDLEQIVRRPELIERDFQSAELLRVASSRPAPARSHLLI